MKKMKLITPSDMCGDDIYRSHQLIIDYRFYDWESSWFNKNSAKIQAENLRINGMLAQVKGPFKLKYPVGNHKVVYRVYVSTNKRPRVRP